MPGAQRGGDGSGEEIPLGVEGEEAHRGLEQRGVHPLAEPGTLALEQRGGDTQRAENPGGEIEEGDAPRAPADRPAHR